MRFADSLIFMHKYILIAFLFCSKIAISQNADFRLLSKINSNKSIGANKFFTNFEETISPVNLGAPAIICIVALVKKDSVSKHNALAAASSFLLNTGITFAMKYAINRPRPFVTYPSIVQRASAHSPSFPSGHTSSSFATATTLSLSYKKWYVVVPSYLYAATMGYTRMYQGVHYPSDVLVGAVVGTASAWVSHKLTKRFFKP